MNDINNNELQLPDDYEQCCECGYDHEYEFAEAQAWHVANLHTILKEYE